MAAYINIQDTPLTNVGSRSYSMTDGAREAKRSVLSRRTASVSRVSISENAPATLSFHGINYIIGAEAESNKRFLKCPTLPFCKPAELKQILFNLSGQFSNGLNAILGKNLFDISPLNLV